MTAYNSAPVEEDELTEEARKQVQLEQSERMTMQGHVRNLLGMRRKRVAEAWGQNPEAAEDDVQILARDIIDEKHYHAAPVAIPPPTKPETPATPPVVQQPAQGTKWPLWTAILLGLAIPCTAGILMAPWIIEALYTPAPDVVQPAPYAEYQPILLPGKPSSAKD